MVPYHHIPEVLVLDSRKSRFIHEGSLSFRVEFEENVWKVVNLDRGAKKSTAKMLILAKASKG